MLLGGSTSRRHRNLKGRSFSAGLLPQKHFVHITYILSQISPYLDVVICTCFHHFVILRPVTSFESVILNNMCTESVCLCDCLLHNVF